MEVLIKGTKSILEIDYVQELSRARFYAELLFLYGIQVEKSPPFDYDNYSACETWVRCYDGAMALACAHDLIYMEGLAILDCVGVGKMGHIGKI
jgi:hypothetical protein